MNGKVRLYLDLVRFNKVLIRLAHRGSTINYIKTRLAGIKYLPLIDVISGYHNLKSGEKSYLTDLCPFGRYQYIRLPFSKVQERDIFQKKIDY